MPEQLDEEADRTIRRLLYEQWEPANTGNYGPDSSDADADALIPLHYGVYDAELADPQISLNQTQGEFTQDGGRWSGKNSATGGMNQHRAGLVIIQCWAVGKKDYDGYNADTVVELLRKEVERIIGDYHLGPASGPNSDKIHSFSSEWNGRSAEMADGETTVRWQSQVTVTYTWTRET